MYALMLLLVTSAPAPIPRPLPDLKPGVYGFKWGGSEWGTVQFRDDGFYGCRYRVKTYWPVEGFNDCHYEGKWSWNPKTRELTIEEVPGYYNPTVHTSLSKYVFWYGRNLGESKGPGTVLYLRPHK